jgi:hypothetical protein
VYPLVRNLSAFSTRLGVLRSPSRSGSSPSPASSVRIRSCIFLFYICASAAPAPAQTADDLYADRLNLASARRAAELWSIELKEHPKSFEAAWKLARAWYWLGGHGPAHDQKRSLEQGISAGRQAAAIEPKRPEGHFWIAANMGALAEASGRMTGLRYRGTIKSELETVLKLDPAFMQGSADRALGRWYFKVPGMFGGSNKRAEQHLRASLKYAPQSTVSLYFLAEVLIDEDRRAEARALLQQVLDAPSDPEWGPEDQDYKARAQTLLTKLKAK